MAARIAGIDSGSPADRAGLKVGETILEINGIEILDYLDYMYASCQEEIEFTLTDRKVRLRNEDYLPLGITFDTLLIDEPRACHNRCVFCFIDQLPPHMRQSCYFKDDDYRLSFLQGNYVTLTNMQDEDIDRILRYHIPRINVSVQTTNPELRQKMLHNKRAGEVLSYLERLAKGDCSLNTQIVLCPGWNDGAELDRTLTDLGNLGSAMESISVVPVGLSAHRQGLEPLRGFDRDSAIAVIDQVEAWQKRFLESHGTRLVYLGDEFYIMAGRPIPEAESYEGFPQIENGVGLCASFAEEFRMALATEERPLPSKRKTVVTGMIALSFIDKLLGELEGNKIRAVSVKNDFFGESITVTGLITGGDLIKQLKEEDLGEELLLSSSMLRQNEDVFLDDVTVAEVEEALQVKVRVVPQDGFLFLEALLD